MHEKAQQVVSVGDLNRIGKFDMRTILPEWWQEDLRDVGQPHVIEVCHLPSLPTVIVDRIELIENEGRTKR